MVLASMLSGVMPAAPSYEWSDAVGSCVLGSGADAVTVTLADGVATFAGSRSPLTYLGSFLPSSKMGTWGTVLRGASLSDVEVHSTHYYNPAAHPGTTVAQWISGTAFPSCVSNREDGVVEMQLMLTDTVYTKGVKLLLKQSGDDIVGQVASAKYCTGSFVGHDPEHSSQTWNDANIVTEAAPSQGGYGIDQLTFVRKSHVVPTVRVSSAAAVSSIAVSGGISVEVADGAFLDDAGRLPGTIDVTDSRLAFEIGDRAVTFDGTCSGTNGELAFAASPDAPPPGDLYAETGMVFTTSFDDCVIRNLRLADVTNAVGWLGGSNMWAPSGYHADGLFFENDGKTASCQFQMKGGNFIKCVLMEMRQVGPDVQVRTPAARYLNFNDDRYREYNEVGLFKFTPYNGSGGATVTSGPGYCVTNLVLSGAATSASYVGLKGTCASGSLLSFSVSGAESRAITAEATSTYTLPRTSAEFVDVNSNATLILNVAGGGTATYRVRKGGLLSNWANWSINTAQSIDLDGGRVQFGVGGALTYLKNLLCRNGAETFGSQMRLIDGNCAVTAFGSSASVIGNDVLLYSQSARTYNFDVADVTGGPGADLTIRGNIGHVDGVNTNSTLVKTGFGTMRLEGVCSVVSAPFSLAAGTLDIGVSGALDSCLDIAFNGGSISADAGTSNACRSLALTKSASISLGQGASLSFDGVNGWGGAATLDVTLARGAKLRVGKSRSLTVEQLRRVYVNGKRAMQNDSGYVTERPSFVLVLQ